ncbi:MAG: hypothetical protein ACXWBS_06650 [Chthoniobacterales bacterium]
MKNMKTTLLILVGFLLSAAPSFAHDEKENLAGGETKKVTGEVVDLACYIDHGASGEKHSDCAKKCIENGLPVGLKADDGKTYLIIGEHAPLNKELAQYATKKVTLEGKVVSHDGINLIENAVIEK